MFNLQANIRITSKDNKKNTRRGICFYKQTIFKASMNVCINSLGNSSSYTSRDKVCQKNEFL